MSSTHTNLRSGGALADGALLHLTWTVTHTYTDHLPPRLVAAQAGQHPDAVLADPSTLCGGVPDRLADLLDERQDDTTLLPAETEVEITRAELANLPAITDLAAHGWRALQAESDADQPSDAGRALAALLAGLRREGIT